MDALMKARLLNTRFEKIHAHTGPGIKLKPGGKVDIQISASLQDMEKQPRQTIAKVELSVTGIPSEAEDNSQFAFKVEIVCVGLYDWPSLIERPNLKDKEITTLLCNPIYLLAAAEAKRVFNTFEVGSLSLTADMRLANDKKPDAKKSARRKPVAGKADTSKPAVKKTKPV